MAARNLSTNTPTQGTNSASPVVVKLTPFQRIVSWSSIVISIGILYGAFELFFNGRQRLINVEKAIPEMGREKKLRQILFTHLFIEKKDSTMKYDTVEDTIYSIK
jgi:hypothetical protein